MNTEYEKSGKNLLCIYFSLKKYSFIETKTLDQLTPTEYRDLLDLYHVLSPKFLLKEFQESDSNTLNESFYKELLYILGLKEHPKSKKIIRLSSNDTTSILGNAINSFHQKWVDFPEKHLYGKKIEEQKFNLSLELCITWLNRILFLKLLEGQLIKYHNGDDNYSFLSYKNNFTFREINILFFQVLAQKLKDRNLDIQEKYKHIPYLNSTLFTRTDLEKNIGEIKDLNPSKEILVYSKTILKDSKGKKLKGTLSTLTYLLRFMNAYDFGDISSDQIVKEKLPRLINASVLGLIFEKINGYQEGSVYTPSSITMMMCRNTIRRKVINNFNLFYDWECKHFEDLEEEFNLFLRKNKIKRASIREEANSIINNLTICDIAVGSGHFLVSALNELIIIKHNLNILCFQNNYSKTLALDFEINNDELLIETLDGTTFKYIPSNEFSQHVQETLFHEKKSLIENCLFGVDINSNSVKICRLRLWIELLKSAYYTKVSSFKELETLPNIDINIKTGNSLLYRFELDKHWDTIEKENKVDLKEYKKAVIGYKKSKDKKEKEIFETSIKNYKSSIRTFFSMNEEINKKHRKVKEYIEASNLKIASLFDDDPEDLMKKKVLQTLQKKNAKPKKRDVIISNKDWNRIGISKEKLTLKNIDLNLNKLQKSFALEVKDKQESTLYGNAFEWRFEFPEVLNESGDFIGFDVLIANPPYMRVQEVTATQPRLKEIYERDYETAQGSYEFANIFMELAHRLMAKDSESSFIFPHKFLTSKNGEALRQFLIKKRSIHKMLHFGANRVFKGADTFTCVVEVNNSISEKILFYRTPYRSNWAINMTNEVNYQPISYDKIITTSKCYGTTQWHILENEFEFQLLHKLYGSGKQLKDICSVIFQGLATSKDDLYIVDLIDEKENTITINVPISGKTYEVEKKLFKPVLRGKDVVRYSHPIPTKSIFFPYQPKGVEDKSPAREMILELEDIKINYPLTYKFILDHEMEFKRRESGKAGRLQKWWGYIYPKSLSLFEQPKLSSMEINTIYPNIIYNRNNYYHSTTVYSWILNKDSKISFELLLGLANSKLLWWFLKRTGDTLKDDARRFKTNYLNPFPLPHFINKKLIKKIEELVLLRENEQDKNIIKELDSSIDYSVYDLYELTNEEKQIIEDGVSWGWIPANN